MDSGPTDNVHLVAPECNGQRGLGGLEVEQHRELLFDLLPLAGAGVVRAEGVEQAVRRGAVGKPPVDAFVTALWVESRCSCGGGQAGS